MNDELKQFNIDIEDIKEDNNLFDNIQKAIAEMNKYTLSDRYEVILNNNLIEFKEKTTNYRTIFGCRISYDNLPKDVSFIVREDTEPSYDKLQSNWNSLREWIEQQKTTWNRIQEHGGYDYEQILDKMNELEGVNNGK